MKGFCILRFLVYGILGIQKSYHKKRETLAQTYIKFLLLCQIHHKIAISGRSVEKVGPESDELDQ